jgi:hypothetical protein
LANQRKYTDGWFIHLRRQLSCPSTIRTTPAVFDASNPKWLKYTKSFTVGPAEATAQLGQIARAF